MIQIQQRLLHAITEAHLHFTDGRDKEFIFPKLLQHCVELTESGYGFIGEVVGLSTSSPVLHIISFNSHSTSLITSFPTLDFSTPITQAITSRSPSVINNNNNGTTITNLPPSFPPTSSFLGIPLFYHEDIIGMVGIGHNQHGYTPSMVDLLSPFSTTCATLMVGYRKAAEQQNMYRMLENARREAEQSAIAKAHFLSNMSHEIRTPLNGIIGLTSLILDSQMTFDQREMIETVQSSGDLLLSVVNDILDLAKFEAGKLKLHQIQFDVRACVEACMDVVAIGADRKGIELLCDVALDVPGSMLGDFDRVRQILTNLIGNAVKFTDKGEVVVGVKVESPSILRMQRSFSKDFIEGGHVGHEDDTNGDDDGSRVIHFWVRDTGIGIPQDKKDLLFRMYTQIDPFRTNGTGLGLSICKRLVEAMSGKIWATSEQGVGSCFHFAIPTVFTPDKTPYYPTIKGAKSSVIFSHLESHLKVLQDFAQQHGMTPTTYLLSSEDLLSIPHLQTISNSGATIIDLPQYERVISQIERYFREGRASPQTPMATTLDARGIPWPGGQAPSVNMANTALSSAPAAFPPLMLPKATLRLTQISPSMGSMSSPPGTPDLEPEDLNPSPLLPTPVLQDIVGPSSLISTPSTARKPTTNATPPNPTTPNKTLSKPSPAPAGSATLNKRTEKPPGNKNPPDSKVARQRQRTVSVPPPPSPTRPRRNTSPGRVANFLSLFSPAGKSKPISSTPSEAPLRPLPTIKSTPSSPTKSASVPITIPHRSTSVPKSMPSNSPPKLPSLSLTPSAMTHSKSSYAIAYLAAAQTSTPDANLSTTPPRPSIESLNLIGTSVKHQPKPSTSAPTTSIVKSASLPFNKSFSSQVAPKVTSPRITISTTSVPSITSHSSDTTPQASPRDVISPRNFIPPFAVNPNSPRLNVNNNLITSLTSNINNSNLRINTNIGGNSGSTPLSTPGSTPNSNPPTPTNLSFAQGGPIFPLSTPPSPSSFPPYPILLYVPLSAPTPRTPCANLFFLPKPIKISRLSRKLEAIIDHPHSPPTPTQIGGRMSRGSGSVSRLPIEDLILDHQMAAIHPLTIVVGEDNLVGQVVTQRMLSKLGYTAEFYASGDAVLAKLEGRVVDVVLLDLKMPVCDGFECARRICAALPSGQRPHIAAVTANILQSDRDLAASVGFNDYITKPFLLQDLARVLARCKKLDALTSTPFSSSLLPPSPPVPISPASSPSLISTFSVSSTSSSG